jgi:hypothetical protein
MGSSALTFDKYPFLAELGLEKINKGMILCFAYKRFHK